MPTITRQTVVSSLNSFAAAMLALYVAFALDLSRPFWAMMTAYIVSQPFAGAVRSKAVYRMAGTLIGAAATLVLVPNLVNAPYVLSFALALWVGGCLTISLLDRTPRSYLLLLAGYTAALIGFPAVDQPGAIFDIAVSRVEEIGLGIICATVAHSLVFPRSVGEVLTTRLHQWLGAADRGLIDLAEGARASELSAAQRALAAAVSDVRIQATHLPFDTSRLRERQAAVRALHARMVRLAPLLSAMADRRRAHAQTGRRLAQADQAALDDVAAWVRAGSDYPAGQALAARLRERAAAHVGADWCGLLVENLLTLTADAVAALADSHLLLDHVADPDSVIPRVLAVDLGEGGARPLSRDVGLALRSGIVCVAAIMITCTLWIATGWRDGAAAASLVAIFCALFATLDDPAPAIVSFCVASLATLALAAAYTFGVFQAIDGFVLLAAVLFPPLFLIGLLIADPKTTTKGSPLAITFGSALALQPTLQTDFAAFLNGNLAVYVGAFVAVYLTRAARSMTAEASAHRLLRLTWAAIAQLARRGLAAERSDAAAPLVDRVGLLAPRLAAKEATGAGIGEGVLRDLRLAMNLLALKRTRPALAAAERAEVEKLLQGVAAHYDRLAREGARPAPDALLLMLDASLSRLTAGADALRRGAVLSLVAMRSNLFPTAMPFVAATEQSR